MKCYLAGPMTGIPNFNFPAFMAAAAALRHLGHGVHNPAEHDLEMGLDPATGRIYTLDGSTTAFDATEAFRWDFEAILECGVVVFLPGWKKSVGSRAEFTVAKHIGAKMFEYAVAQDGAVILTPFDAEIVSTILPS